jgi:two-component system response regulator HydG
VKDLFIRNSWNGNLRELKNIIRRSVLLSEGQYVTVQELPYNFADSSTPNERFAMSYANADLSMHGPGSLINDTNIMRNGEIRDLKKVALEAECELIQKVLRQTNFNKSKAAKMLKVNRKTLYNKIRSYNLDKAMSQ